jgi:hypothetical protein
MFALPMEPKEVTRDILEESFPPEEVLEKWLNGEDVEWPPISVEDDASVDLRFALGTEVLCLVGPNEWAPGKVSQLWYRESDWPEGSFAPYQIILDDGRAIFAPFDNDHLIRLLNSTEPPKLCAPPTLGNR